MRTDGEVDAFFAGLEPRRQELWILLARERDAFDGAYRHSFERELWRAAARSMDAVERLTRAIVAAGGQ